jgi:hypothetical protein
MKPGHTAVWVASVTVTEDSSGADIEKGAVDTGSVPSGVSACEASDALALSVDTQTSAERISRVIYEDTGDHTP